MRRLVTALLAFLLLAAVPSVANAGPTPGGLASDHVEYVTTIPFEQSTSTGARVVGKYLYTTSWKNFSIYDVSDPANPQLASTTPFAADAPTGHPARVENEDVATNGRILVFSEGFVGPDSGLYVYNVEDKTNPTLLSYTAGYGQHTMSCVLDCKWLYGSDGYIIDLHDPTAPKLLDNRWDDGATVNGHHDVTEVARGLILTATDPMLLLDARKDPAHPKVVAMSQQMNEFIHSVQWPRNAKDKFALSTGETWVPGTDARCDASSGGFTTWDASKWKKTHTITKVDTIRPTAGTYTDGSPPVNAPFGCSSHWFQQNPHFHNGGLVAAGYYNHGTRFFRVASNGKISEVDWFVPFAGGTSAAYWVGDRYVYSVDYERGIYVLKYTGKF